MTIFSENSYTTQEWACFYFLYFCCHHPVGAFVISTSQTSESVHTSTWSFKYTYTGKEGPGEEGGADIGSTEKHWRGNWHLGEEEKGGRGISQWWAENMLEQFCFLLFFFKWILTAASWGLLPFFLSSSFLLSFPVKLPVQLHKMAR